MSAAVGSERKCGVWGCGNEPVRVLEHKADPSLTMPLCAYHIRRALTFLTDEQVRNIVFPPAPNEESGE